MSAAKSMTAVRVCVAAAAIASVLAAGAVARSIVTKIRLAPISFAGYTAPRLEDRHRMAIYVSTGDPRDRSRCYGPCTLTFVPVLVRGRLIAVGGAKQKLLSSIDRGHGVRQVTYNHHPLYTMSSDVPGLAIDDGCGYFSARWVVIGRNGRPDRRMNLACIGPS